MNELTLGRTVTNLDEKLQQMGQVRTDRAAVCRWLSAVGYRLFLRYSRTHGALLHLGRNLRREDRNRLQFCIPRQRSLNDQHVLRIL